MNNHILSSYGGSMRIAYCTVCSAEGLQLLENCQGPYSSGLPFFKHMTKEQFEKELGPIEEKYLTK